MGVSNFSLGHEELMEIVGREDEWFLLFVVRWWEALLTWDRMCEAERASGTV
jgi:hypothetical protein